MVILYSSLPAIQDEHPAAEVIQGNFIGIDSLGGRDMLGLDEEVSEFVHRELGGPDTTPGIGAAVSEFVQSNPNEMPGFGLEVSEFVHRELGGPDTTPDLTAINPLHSDWLLS